MSFILTSSAIGLVILILYKLYKMIRDIYVLSYIQGPRRHLFLGNIPDLLCDRDEIMIKFRSWAKEFYPIYSLTTVPKSFVNVIGPEDIEILLSTKKHSNKSDLYFFLSRWLKEGLIFSNGEKNQHRRKLLTPAFHFRIMQDFIEIFNQQTDYLVKELETLDDQSSVNVVPLLTSFALKAINETSMGIQLDFTKQDHQQYHKNVVEMGNIVAYRISRPWLYNQFIYYHLTPTGRKENRTIKSLHNFTTKIVEERIQTTLKEKLQREAENNNSQPKDKKKIAMLDLLISARDNEQIDLEGICEEVDTFMLAGHESVSLAMSYTLMELANHRQYQDLVVEEMNRVFADDSAVTYQKLMQLNFMEMCIKETLRLFPIVQFVSRVADSDIKTSTGFVIPKGTNINIHIFDLHRASQIYPQPEIYDPYRFTAENISKRHRYAYIPFSAGHRNCIGQKYADLEMKTVLVGILRKFILEPIDSEETLHLHLDLVLRAKYGVKVKFVRRI